MFGMHNTETHMTAPTPTHCWPEDAQRALLIGRIWQPGTGPVLVTATPDGLWDLSRLAPTSSALLELPDVATQVRHHVSSGQATLLGSAQAVVANSDETQRDATRPWLLAPCDLQAVKASGVTFVASMLERVIEEQARGDAGKAESVRQAVVAVIGDNLRAVRPGSPEAAQLKDVLLAQFVASMERPDLMERLTEIRCPVLLIGAQQDLLVDPADLVEMQRRLPAAQLSLHEGSGHMLPLELPEAVSHDLHQFHATLAAAAVSAA